MAIIFSGQLRNVREIQRGIPPRNFFLRLEARQAGSSYIEPEHLLLGLTHDTDSKANKLFGLAAHTESFRQQFASHGSGKPSTSGDLPLSNTSKRVLAYT